MDDQGTGVDAETLNDMGADAATPDDLGVDAETAGDVGVDARPETDHVDELAVGGTMCLPVACSGAGPPAWVGAASTRASCS